MNIKTFGSVCSGIEAASVAFQSFNWNAAWFSEIDKDASKILNYHYPTILNVGDMNNLPILIKEKKIEAPDLICGGTPCQAFSLAGLRDGLNDNRGNLTLKFVDIINTNDKIRNDNSLEKTIILWENVEGVLSDKTNAFGCFLSALSGIDCLNIKNWKKAGYIHGKERNIAWRVLDAKYFGVPQQRKRVFVIAGSTNFYPECILFEEMRNDTLKEYLNIDYSLSNELCFSKENNTFLCFRTYTDCLYSAYGTKWNGNAAAYNGSLFVIQNNKLRRFSPLECERLMGFEDNYTMLDGLSNTTRYKCIGNSWAIPVIKWIGNRIVNYKKINNIHFNKEIEQYDNITPIKINDDLFLNITKSPNIKGIGSLQNIVTNVIDKRFYISDNGCRGILRRKQEKCLVMNPILESYIKKISG